MTEKGIINALPPTNGWVSCGVYARGKFSGNLKVYRPSELLRSPARTPSREKIYLFYNHSTNYLC